jgi:WD40 repeat protein
LCHLSAPPVSSIDLQRHRAALLDSKTRKADMTALLYIILQTLPMELIQLVVAYDVDDIKGTQVMAFSGHSSYVNALVHLTGDYLATGDAAGNICIWNMNHPEKPRYRMKAGASGDIFSLVFMPQLNLLVAGLESGHLRLYNFTNGDCLLSIHAHTGAVGALVVLDSRGIELL